MVTINTVTGELSEAKFSTQWDGYSKDCSEIPVKGNITETAYVPPQIRIQDFMEAGGRLAEERRKRFQSVILGAGEEDEIPLDVMSEPNLDIVDVMREGKAAEARAKKAKNAVVEASARAEAVRKEAAEAAAKPKT